MAISQGKKNQEKTITMIYRLYIYNIILLLYYSAKWHHNSIKKRLNQSTGEAHFYNCINFKVKQFVHRCTPGMHLQYVFLGGIRYMIVVYVVSYIPPFAHQNNPCWQ